MKKRLSFPCLAGLLLLAGCGEKPAPPPTTDSILSADSAPPPQDRGALPADIPLPDGLTFQMTGDELAGSATLDSATPALALVDFFSSQLPENGWLLTETARAASETRLAFTRDSRSLHIHMTGGGGPGISTIHLEWQTAAEDADSRDARAPEEDEELPEPPDPADVPAP